MKKKKILAMSVLWAASMSMYAQKFDAKNEQGVKISYAVLSANQKNVMVTGGERPDTLIIPAIVEHKGVSYQVTAIKKKAYMPSSKFVHRIKRLVLPEGLVEIGDRAFYMAFMSDGKESIYIPSSVKQIGKSAFSKFGAYGTNNARDCQLECLPSFVNTLNCKGMGLSEKSISTYLAYHSRTNSAQINSAVATTTPQNTVVSQPQVAPIAQSAPSQSPTSDVDTSIPTNSISNSNTFAIIIANENYQEEVKVDYALNDGESFRQYCLKVLGLPEENIHLRKDATLNHLRGELAWIQQIAEAFKGKARFIVYYAGHGVPDEKSGTAYLLPVDGQASMLETGYSLASFYKQLGDLPSESIVVFMDACFSGAKRGEGMLASARGVAIKAKAEAPKGKMVVFSAASGDETAYPFKAQSHGMFTYYLLKKLQETKGNCTLGELGEYIHEKVSQQSIVVNRKSQTPMVVPSVTMEDDWKTLRLK